MLQNLAKGLVVIFKALNDSAKEQNDVYFDVLSKGGFEVINIPVLDFEFINLEQLLIKLKKPQDYSGIIFSSPRCVRGVELALNNQGDRETILPQWREQQHYVVGEATATLVEEMGLTTLGKESGNAAALAEIITKCAYIKPFLYPIGSLTNNSFKEKLREHHIDVDDIVVYKTKPHPDLEVNIVNLLDKLREPFYFLYFSPSGVKFTIPIMRINNLNLDNIKFVAIGPSTEKGLREHGLSVYRTVSKPTPAATLEALT